MGYTTDFYGRITINPPLNNEEIDFLNKFSSTRRMLRKNGPYFVDGKGYGGSDKEGDVLDYNKPSDGQPGLWCQWIPAAGGTALEYNGEGKFYDAEEWMRYIIDHFLKPDAKAKESLPFLQANHSCNGSILAQGEDILDRWKLVVTDNSVGIINLE